MKKRNIIIYIIALLIMFIGLAKLLTPIKYTVIMVTVDENGKITLEEIEVKEGSTIGELEIPSRDGYSFLFWTLNGKACNKADEITQDVYLESVWEVEQEEVEVKTYIITFNSDGGNVVDKQKVKEGKKAIEPSVPTKTGYRFIEWTLNGKKFDFDTKIIEDITLIAKWEKSEVKNYTVTFDTNGGSSISSQTVQEGKKVTVPTNPTKTGYRFIEWTLDGKKFDFNTKIIEDITLIAKWEKSEVKNYTVTFNTNGGSSISSQTVQEGKKVTVPTNPTKTGYRFIEWTLNGKKFDFNTTITQDITLVASWQIKNYTVTFNTNGGSSISSQTVQEGKKVTVPTNPTKTGYRFIEWTLNGKKFDFNTTITQNITLVASWKEKEYEPAQIKYSITSTNGKWIFINNPEALHKQYITDNSGKALHSDFINGNAEIYFEHYIQEDIGGKVNYALRFYNPSSTSITLKINSCGSTIVRGDGDRYIDTWLKYYKFEKCPIVNNEYSIAPYSSQYIYLNTYSTGSGWNDYEAYFSTTKPTTKIPNSIIDGVLNVTSSGKLNVESFVFTNQSTIPQNSYDNSNNYIENSVNKNVYSGYYPALPNLKSNITFNIYDNTPTGTLQVKYNTGNTSVRDIWYTHNIGNYAPYNNCYINDSLRPIISNNTATNWGNWAVHYTENITLVNSGNKNRTFAYYVNAYYGGNGVASAIVAFPKNQSLNYVYKRQSIGMWHETQEFLKIWEIVVPANSSITVPTEILLGGNSSGTIGHKVVLVK